MITAMKSGRARIAKIIVARREQQPILTTGDLVACVDAAIPKAVRRKDDGHPARRTFQAVRIAVNDEIAPLEKALGDWVSRHPPWRQDVRDHLPFH